MNLKKHGIPLINSKMKKLVVLNYMFTICLISMGQIKGTVTDINTSPVKFAKIVNITSHSTSISNYDGEFILAGQLGDSIRIHHISYNDVEFEIKASDDSYLLSPKIYCIDEVVVSSKHALKLFKKSCENTFSRLKDNSIARGYLRYLKTENYDTLLIQDIDLDIERKKLKNFNEGERISIFKIQERTACASILKGKELKLNKFICPPINQFDWEVFSKSYNYYEVVDSQYIKLYFLSKKSLTNIVSNFEIIIQKKDSCLLLVAKIYKGSLSNKSGKKLNLTKSNSYIKYMNDSGFSFLSETFDSVLLPDPKKKGKNVEMSLYYKTYENGTHNSKLRPKGYKIHSNIFDPLIVTNRYIDKFWINNSELWKVNYDFEFLSNLKFE